MMPPPCLQIYLRPRVTRRPPKLIVSYPCPHGPLVVSVLNLSHKFDKGEMIKSIDERTDTCEPADRLKTLHLCLLVWPGGHVQL